MCIKVYPEEIGAGGIPDGFEKQDLEAYPPVPINTKRFQSIGADFEVKYWQYSFTFSRWGACVVDLSNGRELFTWPMPTVE